LIEISKDLEGRIQGVCEYLFCDGVTWQDKGEILFVGEIFVNPGSKGVVMEIIRSLYHKNPDAKELHFYRESKYPGRSCRKYTREQIRKLIGG